MSNQAMRRWGEGALATAVMLCCGACGPPLSLVTSHTYPDIHCAPPGFESTGEEGPVPGRIAAFIDARPVHRHAGQLVFVNRQTGRRYVYAGTLLAYRRERAVGRAP